MHVLSLHSLFVADAQTEGERRKKRARYIYALVIFHPPPALDSGLFSSWLHFLRWMAELARCYNCISLKEQARTPALYCTSGTRRLRPRRSLLRQAGGRAACRAPGSLFLSPTASSRSRWNFRSRSSFTAPRVIISRDLRHMLNFAPLGRRGVFRGARICKGGENPGLCELEI